MELNGEWSVEIKLPLLAKLRNARFYFGLEAEQLAKEVAESGIVWVHIDDDKTDDPDPLPEQINAIKYLQENEAQVLEAMLALMNQKVYPRYQENYVHDFDEKEYPSLRSIDDLQKAIGNPGISISAAHKDGYSYVHFFFLFSAEMEHGLEIIFHKDEARGFGPIGEADLDPDFLGMPFDEWLEIQIKEYEATPKVPDELKLHQPHPKYGKLKPWQLKENENYPFELLYAGRLEDLKTYLSSYPDVLKKDGQRMLEAAERQKKQAFIDYLKASL